MARKLVASFLGALLLGVIGNAQSAPFTLTDDSGFPGDLVTLRLIDEDPSAFFGVNLLIQFDPTQLDFVGPLSGELTGDLGNLAEPNVLVPGSVLMNLAGFSLDGLPASLLDLNLVILGSATPGLTSVTVACDVGLNNGGFGDYDSCLFDYDVPVTTGFVTVLERTNGEIPEPPTLALLLLTAVAMGAMRRQRIVHR